MHSLVLDLAQFGAGPKKGVLFRVSTNEGKGGGETVGHEPSVSREEAFGELKQRGQEPNDLVRVPSLRT